MIESYFITVSVLLLGTIIQLLTYTITEAEFKFLLLLLLASLSTNGTRVLKAAIKNQPTKPFNSRLKIIAYSYVFFIAILQFGRLFGIGALVEFTTYEALLLACQSIYGAWYSLLLDELL